MERAARASGWRKTRNMWPTMRNGEGFMRPPQKWTGSIREGLQAVLTIDQTDFSVYRINGTRRFQVLSAERPELSK